MSQPKQPKLKPIRYRKLNLLNGNTIITHNYNSNSAQKVHPKGVLIQFPLLDGNNNEAIESQYNPPVIDLKQYEDQIYRKSNFRAVRALMRTYQQTKRRNSQECMNIVGLDIKKINYLPPAASKDKLQKRSVNKMQNIESKRKLSPQLRNLSSRSQKARKTSEQSETIPTPYTHSNTNSQHPSTSILKLQMTQSAFLARKRISQMIPNTTSPIKSKPKTKYLYQKLAGTENNNRQQTNLIYDKRIKSFTDLIFKIQFAHNIYINLDLKNQQLNSRSRRIKYYVGPGNNSAMIKGLLKRRYWWVPCEQRDQSNFVWTQIKVNLIFQKQKRANKALPIYKADIQNQQQEQQGQVKKSKKRMLSPERIRKLQNNQISNLKILNNQDEIIFKRYTKKYQLQKQRTYAYKVQRVQKVLKEIQYQDNIVHNHLEHNFYLGNKKALFYNLKQYYDLIGQSVFETVPLTFHIKKGMKDPQYKRFIAYYNRRSAQIKKQEVKQQQEGSSQKKKTRNIWIVKPGQNSNQGRGITVIDQIYQLNNIIKRIGQKKPIQQSQSKSLSKLQKNLSMSATSKIALQDQADVRTYIVQMYLDRPMLYNNRKFDIRHYMLITNLYGVTRAYWYAQGYIRTSSYQFNISNFQPQIHLTNDAVQKKFPQYGKYEPYNKISYEQFQRYLDSAFSSKKYDFKKQILPSMKRMATDAARSVYTKITPKNQMNNFQIFGLDFMIDNNFRPWLIQINTNPCLDCVCPLLDRIIPYMVEQSFKLTLDVVYPPPSHYPNTCKHFAPMVNLQQFKYQLIFDSQTEGQQLRNLYRKVKGNLMAQIGQIEEDEQFKDDGKQIKLDDFT